MIFAFHFLPFAVVCMEARGAAKNMEEKSLIFTLLSEVMGQGYLSRARWSQGDDGCEWLLLCFRYIPSSPSVVVNFLSLRSLCDLWHITTLYFIYYWSRNTKSSTIYAKPLSQKSSHIWCLKKIANHSSWKWSKKSPLPNLTQPNFN